MHIRPAAVPDSISDEAWVTVVSLTAALDTPALDRTITMTTEQVRSASTTTAYDAAITLLLAAVEQQEYLISPSGDPARRRLVATARVGVVLDEVLAARTARCVTAVQ